jgi:hypothetical protein
MNYFDEPVGWVSSRRIQKLNQNSWTPGWEKELMLGLRLRLKEETKDLENLLVNASPENPVDVEQIINESEDIANFVCYDYCGQCSWWWGIAGVKRL